LLETGCRVWGGTARGRGGVFGETNGEWLQLSVTHRVAAAALGKAKPGLSHFVPDPVAEVSAAVSQADVNVVLWFVQLLSFR